METPRKSDALRIDRHGDVTAVTPEPQIEEVRLSLVQEVADIILNVVEDDQPPLLVFDLSEVEFISSAFLALLLRCWKPIASRGGLMLLCGVSTHARNLLRITRLDTVWAIYETQRQAIEVLQEED